MLKKTIIAVAALGFVGAATLTPSTPAEAFFFTCAKGSKHANSDWCKRRAERQAKWAAFWQNLFGGHRKRR
jgi:hypothetical protein